MEMSFRNWIASVFGRKKKPEEGQFSEQYIQKLNAEIKEMSKEYQELIEGYEDVIRKLKVEIADVGQRYREAKNKLEKECEKTAVKEKELEGERKISSGLRKELEMRRVPIKEYEESIQKLKEELTEMSNRYQEAIEKLNKEMDNAISLEMLILELDRELGLTDIVKKLDKKGLHEIRVKK